MNTLLHDLHLDIQHMKHKNCWKFFVFEIHEDGCQSDGLTRLSWQTTRWATRTKMNSCQHTSSNAGRSSNDFPWVKFFLLNKNNLYGFCIVIHQNVFCHWFFLSAIKLSSKLKQRFLLRLRFFIKPFLALIFYKVVWVLRFYLFTYPFIVRVTLHWNQNSKSLAGFWVNIW